jgi:arabinan endo-1,5-alpha-L-arabinosidase
MEFTVQAEAEGDGFQIHVTGDAKSKSYVVPADTQQEFSAFYRSLSEDFGTRLPHVFDDVVEHPAAHIPWQPLLTENIAPRILVGYGDPAVFKDGDDYWLVATSNDAPDAFPILHSRDLTHWECVGFAFPEGQELGWAAKGRNVADFWAPEMHKVGDEYWLVYTARQATNALAIGLARASSPLGSWVDNGAPLVTGKPVNTTGLGYDPAMPQMSGGVIDSHLFVDNDGERYLLWKDDTNSIWPRPLAMLLRQHPELIGNLFAAEADRRTAAFAAAIVPWANVQRPMVRFFLMHPLIETALANWTQVRKALVEFGLAPTILEAMTTPIRGRPIAADGRSLMGQDKIVLCNDLDWEGHLIEGPFVTQQEGRYWLFYAGNDFSTPSYGIGVAVADHPLGPYTKQGEPLLRSTSEWLAPGHASVAPGLTDDPQLFFHAFHPGTGGYNAFRALLTVGLKFNPTRVEVVALD